MMMVGWGGVGWEEGEDRYPCVIIPGNVQNGSNSRYLAEGMPCYEA